MMDSSKTHLSIFNVSQHDLDRDIERLIQESPIPQVYLRGMDGPNASFAKQLPCMGRPMSASAIPQLHSYAMASPLAQAFNPFMSPQCMNATYPSAVKLQTAAEIFNSMKNQSNLDHSACNASHENVSFKENSSFTNEINDGSYLYKKSSSHAGSLVRRQKPLQERVLNAANTNTVNNQSVYENDTNTSVDQGLHLSCESILEADDEDELHACSLFMWIIKPVAGTHSICVEGKKSILDDNFWHSGAIKRRINERLVETVTGSIYKLEGNMELLDALAAGFSRKTADAFWLGFPEDWERLIQEHFRHTQINRFQNDTTESDGEIETMDEDETDGQDVETVRSETWETAVTDSTDKGEQNDTLTEEKVEEKEKRVNGKKKDAQQNCEVQQKKREKQVKEKEKETVLENWIIKLLPDRKGIHVVGMKLNGFLWHSSAIEKRLEKRRLLSSTKSVYKLKGPMDKLLALEEGLPMEIINKFSSGFPKEWQELIQEHLCTKTKTKTKKSKEKSLKPSEKKLVKNGKKKSGADKKEEQSQNVIQKEMRSAENTKITDSESRVEHVRSTLTGYRPLVVEEMYERKKIVLTPNGEMVDLELLGRSRSGRLIKPPLQWWTGQTLEMEGENVKVRAPTVASSRFLNEFEEGYKKSRRKLKQYWNPRQKDKDYSALNFSKLSFSSSLSSVGSKSSSVVSDSEKIPVLKLKKIEDTSLDEDFKLKHEVNIILENSKRNKKKVEKRNTCYSAGSGSLKPATEVIGDAYDIQTDDTEDESKVRNVVLKTGKLKKSQKQKQKQDKEKVEQENVVSSSTGDVNEIVADVNVDKGTIRTSELEEEEMKNRNSEGKVVDSDNQEVKKTENEEETESDGNDRVTRRRLRSYGCKKALPVIEEQDTADEKPVESSDAEKPNEDGETEKLALKKTRSKKSLEKKRGKVEKDVENKEVTEKTCELENDIHWTKEEKNLLMDACKSTAPNQPQYWDKVAEKVRTKTAEACRIMYFGEEKETKSSIKKKNRNSKEKPKVTSLTANKGTLKRKQQLRDLLEQQNENYSDDLFDSTPFRVTRKRKIPLLGDNEDEDAIFEKLAKRQGKSRFETPVATTTAGSRFTAPFASSKKTPVSSVVVEPVEESSEVDGYVHRLMKRRLLAKGKKKKLQTPKASKKVNIEISPQQKLFEKLLKEKKDTSENHRDSDLEEDFYWEDEDNE